MKYFKENNCVFVLRGSDVINFLQRVTTNDINKLSFNSSIRTIFLNDKGRILDFVILLRGKEDVRMIATNENMNKLINHLEKFIVADDVSYSLDLTGKFTFIPEEKDELYQFTGVKFIEGNYFISDDYSFNKIIGLEINKNSGYWEKLVKNSTQLSEQDFLRLAIENAYIYSENELNENINPFDCQLHEYISFKKGCFIGQEVIARLDSQGKTPKVMVKINSRNKLIKGDKIYSKHDGNEIECGFISSSVQSNNEFLGLGFIREINFNETNIYYINKFETEIISINKLKN